MIVDVLKVVVEALLGFCIFLYINNGRIHYKDIIGTFGFGPADENGYIEDGLTKELKERGIEW